MREVEEGGGSGGGGAKSGTLKQTDQRFEKIKETYLVVGVISSEADAPRVPPPCFDDVICGAIMTRKLWHNPLHAVGFVMLIAAVS